jgi:hypothetical protein
MITPRTASMGELGYRAIPLPRGMLFGHVHGWSLRSTTPLTPRLSAQYQAPPLPRGMQFGHRHNLAFRATTPITPRIIGMSELDYRAVPLDFPIYLRNPPPIPPVFTGRSWWGNFQWYGFTPYGWIYSGQVADYYLTKTAGGNSRMQQWGSMPYNPATVMGYIDAQGLGGALIINPTTGAQTGAFTTTWLYMGNMCSGVSFRGSYGGYTGPSYYPKTGISLATMLPFYTGVSYAPLVKFYTNCAYPTQGYLITWCGNPMWGLPGATATETLSNTMTIIQAASNGGAVLLPSFVGHTRIDSYGSVSGAMVGLVSEVDLIYATPSVTGWVLVTLTYEKTLITGGPTITITEDLTFNVGIGGTLHTTHLLPMLTGYDVVLTNIVYQDIGICMDDAEQIPDGSSFGSNVNSYPTTPEWIDQPAFQTDGPGENWDDGEDMADGAYTIMTGGDGWPENGLLAAFDIPWEMWDDAEGYIDGPIDWTWAGEGWLEWGSFTVADYPMGFDDGETYMDGVLVDADGYLITEWADIGLFQIDDYLHVVDAGETYPDGNLTLADGGDNWLGDGTFQIN